MSYPTTRLDRDGIVHIVAYDGIRFCGPYSNTTPRWEGVPTQHHVTCLRCMSGWSGHLKEPDVRL